MGSTEEQGVVISEVEVRKEGIELSGDKSREWTVMGDDGCRFSVRTVNAQRTSAKKKKGSPRHL